MKLLFCDGLRPDFGKGVPEVYKSLALETKLSYWNNCLCKGVSGDVAKKIKMEFDIANKEIPHVQKKILRF
jgi:hypothetical protein